MLFVPVGGTPLNVSMRPATPYAEVSCKIPPIVTRIALAVDGATVKVNEIVELFPENVSMRNAVLKG